MTEERGEGWGGGKGEQEGGEERGRGKMGG